MKGPPEWLQRVRARKEPKRRRKFNYVGAPACFALEQACQHINAAFGEFGCYQVGSSLERPDFRDVDVRFIMEDEKFAALFPDVDLTHGACLWEHDPRWLLLTVAIAGWLKQQTGLPVDFQIWPQTHANKLHGGKARNPAGYRYVPKRKADAPD